MVEDNPLFKKFIPELTSVLQSNELSDSGTQRQMLIGLFDLEEKFRTVLLSTKQGRAMYEKFVTFIIDVKGNTLTYSIYFREDGEMLLKAIKKIFNEEKKIMNS